METTALFQTFTGWKSSEGPRRGVGCMVQRADAKGVRRCCIRIRIASSPRLIKVVIVAYVVSLRFFCFFRSAWSLPSPSVNGVSSFPSAGSCLPFNWVSSFPSVGSRPSHQLGLIFPSIRSRPSPPSAGSYLPLQLGLILHFNWVSSFPSTESRPSLQLGLVLPIDWVLSSP